MSTLIPIYPFDPDGTAATNLVHEQQSIESNGVFDYFYVIPKAAPFYAGDSLKLTLYPGGKVLKEGKDYNLGYHFMDASHTIGLPVYGAITFYDRKMKGIVDMQYQTLGGSWTLDDVTIAEILANEIRNPRTTSWETIVELPERFPVVNHKFDIDDFVGMSEVEDKLEGIKEAILAKGAGAIEQHIANKNNPHDTTKSQVGLGLVDNFATASVAEAQAGTANNRFMTPLRTRQAIETLANGALDAHKNDLNNPHNVTKAQVGLGLVQNLQLASQAEAEAGAANTRYMTPLRVREAIDAIVGSSLTSHIGDRNNPHGTNKGHVGLGNVQNFALASNAQAQAGTANDLYMTPLLTRYTIMALVGDNFAAHRDNINNPHQTNKSQVGLGNVQNFGLATEAEARDATVDNKYMTPLRVRQAINELVGEISGTHTRDFNNPHQVTKNQVGLGNVQNYDIATQAEAEAGVATDKYMTAQRVAQAIAKLAGGSIGPHLNDYDNPHNTTAAQVGAYSTTQVDNKLAGKLDSSGVAADASRVFGLTQAQLIALMQQQKVADSSLLEGKTLAQVKAETLTGKAADSGKLNGKTYDQIKAEIGSSVAASSIQYTIPELGMVKNASNASVVPPGNWMKFGTIKMDPTRNNFRDLTLFMTGARDDESRDDEIQSSGILSISVTAETPANSTEITMSVKRAEMRNINFSPSPFKVAYRPMGANATAELELWIYSNKTRTQTYLTELSVGSFSPVAMTVPTNVSQLITTRPTGLVDVANIGSADEQSIEILTELTATLDEIIAEFNA